MVDRVFERSLGNIEETRRLLDVEDLRAASEMLVAARAKYVVGMRSSTSVAYLLGHYMRLALENVHIITTGGPTLFEQLLSVDEPDVVVAISFPRFTKWTVDGLRYARARGARTIAISDSKVSPAAQVAHVALSAPGDSITFGNSYVAPVLLVDALIAAIAYLSPESALARLDLLEAAFDGNDFFYGEGSIVHPLLEDGRHSEGGRDRNGADGRTAAGESGETSPPERPAGQRRTRSRKDHDEI